MSLIKPALVRQALRDNALLIGIALAALFGFELLYTQAMHDLSASLLKFWQEIPFLRTLLMTLAGLDVSGEISATTLMSLGLVAPFLIIVTWGVIVTVCTSLPVGEIDRGTADLLFSLPISRASLYCSLSATWLALSVAMALTAWGGLAAAERLVGTAEPLDHAALLRVVVNLMLLFAAVCGLSLLVSSFTSRRPAAVGLVIGTLAVSFMLNFLAAFQPSMRAVSFLGVLDYYRPVDIVRGPGWPLHNMLVLAAVAIGCWSVGLWRFCRRDIPAA